MDTMLSNGYNGVIDNQIKLTWDRFFSNRSCYLCVFHGSHVVGLQRWRGNSERLGVNLSTHASPVDEQLFKMGQIDAHR